MKSYSDQWISLRNLRISARLLSQLPLFLWNPTEPEEALGSLKIRLAQRERNFLSHLRGAVFKNGDSPYRSLFRHAGCELDDVKELLSTEGLEGTLKCLFKAGVYLTVGEFKGREPICRGSTTIDCHTDQFRNPRSALHLSASSGGSRSGGTPVLFDLDFIRACAANCLLYLKARGGVSWINATWEVPGGGARFRLVKFAGFKPRPRKWFSQVDPADPELDPLYAWSSRTMRWGSLLVGVPLPAPVFAPVTNPEAVGKWIRRTLDRGEVPHIMSFPSSAVSLCRWAASEGVDVSGTRFTLGGEPTTRARIETLTASGVDGKPRYGSVETGVLGYSCLAPEEVDEVHLVSDMHAAIQACGESVEKEFPPKALLVTSLHPRSPFTFLNTSMGDQAAMVRRQCGCPLEKLGWSSHLRRISSYEKLTSAGMTFSGTDVVRVLEEVLPHAFGGTPTDYQLIESESEEGEPILTLSVHPRLGNLDEELLLRTFQSALGEGSMVHRLMEKAWREGRLLRIKRTEPIVTQSGKILHFHVLSRSNST